jgi:hypothetical protein
VLEADLMARVDEVLGDAVVSDPRKYAGTL